MSEMTYLEEARAFISRQLALLQAGDLEGLRRTFSRRQQDRITPDALEKAKQELARYSLDDLAFAVEERKDGIKIKMKNGRTLTLLVKEDDGWKADTVWMK